MLAQKFHGFYLEPNISWKIFTSKASNQPPSMTTPYFSIKAKQFIYPKNFSPLFIGLNLGYTFKNDDKIQLGFSQDDILQGVDVSAITITGGSGNLYGQETYSHFGGTACTNYSFIYKRNILFIQPKSFKNERFISVFLNLGISYIYKPNNGVETLSGTYGFNYIAQDSSLVEFEITPYNLPINFKDSFKFNLGLDFTIGKKDKELFGLNISFITNRSQGTYFGFTSVQAKVTDKNNNKTQYSYYVKGPGNGIYFTLTKRIYPFKIFTDRRNKKIERHKHNKD